MCVKWGFYGAVSEAGTGQLCEKKMFKLYKNKKIEMIRASYNVDSIYYRWLMGPYCHLIKASTHRVRCTGHHSSLVDSCILLCDYFPERTSRRSRMDSGCMCPKGQLHGC